MTMAGTTTAPRSPHVGDSSVQPFLQPGFDPVDYLNSTLPPLSAGQRAGQQYGRSVPLPELSSQIQGLLAQWNAQTTRLSTALTQLTDEIIRSGGRLAYEVEVLRGDTFALADTLENGLKKDMDLFTKSNPAANVTTEHDVDGDEATAQQPAEPEYVHRLRTLTLVRQRLDSVIQTFGAAMAWPLAPSELASSLISVSAPESDAEARSREQQAKEYIERIRTEINDLVGDGNDVESLEAAMRRVEELRELSEVWKGTAEEKARARLVEGLRRPVEERLRSWEKGGQGRKPGASPVRGIDYRYGDAGRANGGEGGYGFLQNLRNLKNEMYLE